MPSSVTSAFTEAADFEAALREGGGVDLLVTGPGAFRARLTRIALLSLRLASAEEHLPRILLVAAPPGMILVALPGAGEPAPVLGGISMGPREIMTLGPGERLHMRSHGPYRWGGIWLPATELVRYASVMTGTAFTIPCAAPRWRLRPAISRHLRQLHSAAIGFVEGRSKALMDGETAHGLEQQLIEALVKGLAKGSAIAAAPATREHREVVFRFEALLQADPERAFQAEEICAALGVSAQTLPRACAEQLGMGPIEYARRRRMQLVHRALRRGNCETASIADLARRYGFRGLGRFAADYRALYGELPSATLRRGLDPAMAQLRLRRTRRPM
jgi:AraC family transcriptional regulator, ethanolamine operon transcriptional activator